MVVTYLGNRLVHLAWSARRRPAPRDRLFIVFNMIGLGLSVAHLGDLPRPAPPDQPLADNVSANVVGLALGTLFRYWSYKRFVFAPATPTPAIPPRTPLPVLAQRSDEHVGAEPRASSRSVASRVPRHEPGADVLSVSWSSTVPPGRTERETVATIVAGVACRDQSTPHEDQRTVCRPALRAAYRPSAVITPYGGAVPGDRRAAHVLDDLAAADQVLGEATGPRTARQSCSQPCTASSWPAAAISRTSCGSRWACEASRKKVAETPRSASRSRNSGVGHRSGPSSKVRATWWRWLTPASRGRNLSPQRRDAPDRRQQVARDESRSHDRPDADHRAGTRVDHAISEGTGKSASTTSVSGHRRCGSRARAFSALRERAPQPARITHPGREPGHLQSRCVRLAVAGDAPVRDRRDPGDPRLE